MLTHIGLFVAFVYATPICREFLTFSQLVLSENPQIILGITDCFRASTPRAYRYHPVYQRAIFIKASQKLIFWPVIRKRLTSVVQ
ncbi:hypothetical protein BDD26_3523 [Xenorhabdus cabanillasii]|uniref:Uncharacterized protein n=1 Tax=Xenorhabdus cabanillasii TaxID=351673 RepID=A0A3D9UGJ2_9GAMM|nr:hypothetical protein [Xenorhabdus cabanillasii]REF28588.1 hypothetical protein BDD26_3523 [Xenorhabdus cabanillasii]